MENPLKYFSQLSDPRVEGRKEHLLEEILLIALGCQKTIAQKIVDKQASYILAVKENQLHLLEDIRDSFKMLPADSVVEQLDCGHGRVETRTCCALGGANPDFSQINRKKPLFVA